jgi:hypothetical protein
MLQVPMMMEPASAAGGGVGALWRLGDALVPQPAAPDCIDAVFIHKRMLLKGMRAAYNALRGRKGGGALPARGGRKRELG